MFCQQTQLFCDLFSYLLTFRTLAAPTRYRVSGKSTATATCLGETTRRRFKRNQLSWFNGKWRSRGWVNFTGKQKMAACRQCRKKFRSTFLPGRLAFQAPCVQWLPRRKATKICNFLARDIYSRKACNSVLLAADNMVNRAASIATPLLTPSK